MPVVAAQPSAAVTPGTTKTSMPWRSAWSRSAAPEDEGIATLEPHDLPAGAGMRHQQGIDLVLGVAVPSAPLADIDVLGVPARVAEDCLADQLVMQDHVGRLEQLQGTQGQQVR